MGRGPELEVVTGFLDGLVDGPATLVFEGEAGIGKTTLWTATLDQARRRGLRVLSCRAAATEVQLGLTGLADLLHGIEDGIVASLPIVQQRALAAALLADDGSGGEPDGRALAAGFLSVVATLAEDGPVIVAIDDLQWLDVSSYQVVAYAARRWAGPVGLVASQRVPGEGAVRDVATRDPERVSRLRVTPLTLAAVHELLVERTGRSLTRPPLVRLNSVAHGNPFYALELARTVGPTSGHGEMSLPESLAELISARIGRLGPDAREVLVVASALPVATVDLVRTATGRAEVVDLLGPAEEDGLITIAGGVIDFAHPLLARGVYEGAPRWQRRALHRRLSELVPSSRSVPGTWLWPRWNPMTWSSTRSTVLLRMPVGGAPPPGRPSWWRWPWPWVSSRGERPGWSRRPPTTSTPATCTGPGSCSTGPPTSPAPGLSRPGPTCSTASYTSTTAPIPRRSICSNAPSPGPTATCGSRAKRGCS